MGYNTVAFVLNDFSSDIIRSPNTIAFKLANPPFSKDDETRRDLINTVKNIAQEFKEPVPHSQALCVMPTFHSSEKNFYVAGGNHIEHLEVKSFGKDQKTGRKTVTLLLPDWW